MSQILEPLASVLPIDSLRRLMDSGVALPVAVAASAYGAYTLLTMGQRTKDMPPGPPTVPIFGNALIFPKEFPHFQFSEWAKQYGDVFSVKVFGQTIIVINSPTMMKEIIDKRAASNTNRPASILADMITPNNMNLGTGHYANETWNIMRRASMRLLNADTLRKHRPYQAAEATQLMWDVAHEPAKWFTHINRYTTSFALGLIYGQRAPRRDSTNCAAFLEVHPEFMHALELGTMPPVDLFPVLTLVPERWAEWKRTVKGIRKKHETLYWRMLRTVEARIEKGLATDVFMEEAILNRKEWDLDDDVLLMNLGGTLLEGTDTTSGTMQGVVLALVAFQDKQKKLREELDRVVGPERTPTFEDIPNLPYLNAFLEECHRFRPVGPLGLPHEMVHDEYVDGMLLPKGAVLFVNMWGISHDERYFDKPEEFIPERFLDNPLGVKAGVQDDPARRKNLIFGGGRRICPGLIIANTSLEIILANFIWAFEFLPELDAQGREVPPNLWNHTTGITAIPKPFNCRIVPRSQEKVETIDRAFARSAEVMAPYELELDAEDRNFNKVWRDTGLA